MSKSTSATAPRAPARPTTLTAHGDDRVDPWFWLRDREDPEVLAYLEAENDYTKAALGHTEGLQAKLYDEIVARIQETDLSPPVRKGEWWYYSRTVEGLQYGINCRKFQTLDADEQVLLDQNAEAEGHDYFAVGVFDISPDHALLAYGTDTSGAEKYTVRFRDLATGDELEDVIEGAYYGSAWSTDNATFFYTRPDGAMRPYQVWRHRLGTPVADDVLVYQEDDDAYFLGVHLEKDEQVIMLHAGSKITDEWRYFPANQPDAEPIILQARVPGLEYSPDHHGDRFFITTNHEAVNFRLMETPVNAPGMENWTEVIPHRDDVKLDGVDGFADYLVLFERAEALRRIRVMRLADGDIHTIEQPESVYTAGPGSNPEFASTVVRYGYTSLVTPQSVYDYDMVDRTRELIKQQPVLGGYDPTAYVTERVWATATDGERVPVSLVYRNGTPVDGSAPCLLYGYGSYESSTDPSFSSIRLNLVDRGFVFAIAHIRGGGEMGRRWYDDGKMLHKRNTFTDFIAAAEHLVATKYTASDRLVIRGGSAGGLLMGAVVNLRPDLFKAVVAQVPFVDCLTTILDETLPLTVIEWDEWGNPKADADVYAYMKSYSPYDNVEAKDYPAMLVTAGLNDPRVSYWEPAKWVAKLRVTKTDDNLLLLKTEMGAGHMGPSGRYNAWKDEAFDQAFILDAVGITA
ncbi:MAG TPA: S9 family peptidase [Acidimicrobiales bacterium]|nr:S9 family peptidase [Acidimicrobiales bacterium]